MRPISLTMQSFGVYLEPVTLDFSQLGEHPIFLITGCTGGGKTTILDAMCFALYCRATGGRRSWNSMRGTAAPDSLPTMVDFSFALGQEEYRFCRAQSVHIVRGSQRREIRYEHTAYRKKEGAWDLIGSGSETKVRECAQEILGLTCEQFSQVIVLPQGDFLKLLRASSVNKAEILQTLFATKLWSDVAKRCKAMADDLERQAGDCSAARLSILEREGVETREELLRKQQETQEAATALREKVEEAQERLKQETEQWEAAKELCRKIEEKQKLEQRRMELDQRREAVETDRESLALGRKIQTVFPYFEAWRTAEKDRESKSAARVQAQENAGQAEKNAVFAEQAAKDIPTLREKSAAAAQELVKLKEIYQSGVRLRQVSRELDEKVKQISIQEQCRTQAEEAVQDAEARLKKGEAFVKEAQEAVRTVPDLAARAQSLEQQRDALVARSEKKKALEKIEAALADAQRERDQCAVRLDAERERLRQEEEALRQDQAKALAAVLEDGIPCPVCGSKSHPSPAYGGVGRYNAEQLELLRSSVEDLQKRLQPLEQAFLSSKAQRDQIAADWRQQEAACRGITIGQEKLTVEWEKAAEMLRSAQSAGDKLIRFQARIDELKKGQAEAQKKREQAVQLLVAWEREAAVLQTSRAEILRSMCGYSTIEEMEQKRVQLQQEEKSCEEQAEILEKRFALAKTALAVAQTEVAAVDLACREAEEKHRKAKEAWEQALRCVNLPLGLDVSPLKKSGEELERLESTISAYEQEVHTVKKQLVCYTEELAGKEIPDMMLLEKKKTETSRKSQELAQQLGSLLQKQQMENQSLEQLDALTQSGKDAEEQFAKTSRLAQWLMGKNPLKIPLHQFVLGIMLDDILSYANRFFSMLSQGRYSLRRILGSTGGNSLGGLDLEVLDANLGGTRSIETLSGGEQFLASLSLAFGLSDVVQSYSGSVRLDSIFIDEGFGSLDQDTLDTAMKALSQIQKMGRTIGIISHVSELKNRIAARVEVGKNPHGGATLSIFAN